jgi:hypothetical protein
MNEVTLALAAALAAALLAVVILAAVVPRRIAVLMAAEGARNERRANIAQAALYAASATEVAEIVAPLRALLDEQARQAYAAREHGATSAAAEVERITRSLRGLVEWLALFASTLHAQASAAGASAPETTRKPDRAPASRPRPSPHAPAIAPPGSAEPLPPGPAHLAAGLGRPKSSGPPQSGPAPLGGGERRRATVLGLAPPAAPRRPAPSAPTLLSMPSVAQQTARPAPSIVVDGERGITEPRSSA